MDSLILYGGVTIFAALFLACIWTIQYMILKRYPKVKFAVFDRGSLSFVIFRRYGNLIIWDKPSDILLGKIQIHGDFRDFESFKYGKEEVYLAYKRNHYLFALKARKEVNAKNKNGEDVVVKLSDIPPQIEVEAEVKNGIFTPKLNFGKGLLLPIRVTNTNEELSEQEVLNGQSVGGRLIDAILNNKQFNESQSPLINALISVLPQAVLLVIAMVGMYLIMGEISSLILPIVDKLGVLVDKLQPLVK